jgi:hypothetical protein
MISPQEIKEQGLKWWKPFLQSHLKEEVFFPRNIDRIGKIKSSSVRENINELQVQLDELYKNEKGKLGFGYIVNREDVRFRRTGNHSLPKSITFECSDDFIAFIGKTKEWDSFVESTNLIQAQVPQLKDWVINNPLVIIENKDKWHNLIQVCKYFLANPNPGLYIRQLPIDLHTKFIEQNEVIIRSLLDFLIPHSIHNNDERTFSKRYSLKYDQPTIRIRILDEQLKIDLLSDLSIPLSDFEQINFNCKNVVLTENKMTFLALPNLKSTIAVWSGGGFMISYLKNVKWLHEKKITYWGDLDSHGFAILNQMRTYFPQTVSAMMDMETFELFKKEGLVAGEKVNAINLSKLSEAEMKVFLYLKEHNFRLEQEKIRQHYVDAFFRQLFQ